MVTNKSKTICLFGVTFSSEFSILQAEFCINQTNIRAEKLKVYVDDDPNHYYVVLLPQYLLKNDRIGVYEFVTLPVLEYNNQAKQNDTN